MKPAIDTRRDFTMADLLDRIRYDHLWLYEIIADKTMMVQWMPHWKR